MLQRSANKIFNEETEGKLSCTERPSHAQPPLLEKDFQTHDVEYRRGLYTGGMSDFAETKNVKVLYSQSDPLKTRAVTQWRNNHI